MNTPISNSTLFNYTLGEVPASCNTSEFPGQMKFGLVRKSSSSFTLLVVSMVTKDGSNYIQFIHVNHNVLMKNVASVSRVRQLQLSTYSLYYWLDACTSHKITWTIGEQGQWGLPLFIKQAKFLTSFISGN